MDECDDEIYLAGVESIASIAALKEKDAAKAASIAPKLRRFDHPLYPYRLKQHRWGLKSEGFSKK
jgi:hypothetical protein